jgi:hypothetical protein
MEAAVNGLDQKHVIGAECAPALSETQLRQCLAELKLATTKDREPLTKQQEELRVMCEATNALLTTLCDSNKALTSGVESLRSEVAQLQTNTAHAQAQIEALQSHTKAMRRETAQLQADTRALRSDMAQLQATNKPCSPASIIWTRSTTKCWSFSAISQAPSSRCSSSSTDFYRLMRTLALILCLFRSAARKEQRTNGQSQRTI